MLTLPKGNVSLMSARTVLPRVIKQKPVEVIALGVQVSKELKVEILRP